MKFSRDNLIGLWGFLVLSFIGVVLAFSAYCFKPLALLFDLGTATAKVNNEYTRNNTTRKGVSFTSYQLTYTFEVNGQQISGDSSTDQIPQEKMLIQYRKSNPRQNGFELSGNAYFDLCIFGFICLVFFACVTLLIIHYKSKPNASPTEQPRTPRKSRRPERPV